MNTMTDITGRETYLLQLGSGPFVIKVEVYASRPGPYVAFLELPNSLPGAMIPDLCDLLTAVHQRLEAINHR